MSQTDLNRRDFQRLAIAALSGLTLGCESGVEKAYAPASATGQVDKNLDVEQLVMTEPHVCRGLNSCKNLGRSKENECAGQGTCASIANHDCGTNNECKGQGGCGETPGMNSCKGQGKCSIPLMEEAWGTARKAFETAMKKHEKPFGSAPAKKK